MVELAQSMKAAAPVPSVVPIKRMHGTDDEQQHAPAVPSPLNPDFANAKARKPAPTREQREKKESLKKREAKGIEAGRPATPDGAGTARKVKKTHEAPIISQSLIRYTIPLPKKHDFEPASAPVMAPSIVRAGRQFFESQEHVFNRKGFRYSHCIADPAFRCTQFHRQTEVAPHEARFNFEDSSPHIRFDESVRAVSTEKGFRMARANVAIREGRWYWECKILSGVKDPTNVSAAVETEDGGHVRIGLSRREASLDTPVGFDAYSYGIRDVSGQKVYRSRPQDFFPSGESLCEGDVIGFEIQLPSLAMHHKVVAGTYNKAVDLSDDVDPIGLAAPNIIRDRLPIRYRSHLYFEQFEYQSCKELEDYMHPPSNNSTSSGAMAQDPNPNHPLVALRTLPSSYVKVYKNGRSMGTAFTDLLAFLPLASKPTAQGGAVGAREGLDDGSLGYYPSISVFRGGAAEANFGPDFAFAPPELTQVETSATSNGITRLRPLSERYAEQIAEDVVYDIIDEVDMWMTDRAPAEIPAQGEEAQQYAGKTLEGIGLDGTIQPNADEGRQARPAELTEVVQDEE